MGFAGYVTVYRKDTNGNLQSVTTWGKKKKKKKKGQKKQRSRIVQAYEKIKISTTLEDGHVGRNM
jgi:hypothetical protein